MATISINVPPAPPNQANASNDPRTQIKGASFPARAAVTLTFWAVNQIESKIGAQTLKPLKPKKLKIWTNKVQALPCRSLDLILLKGFESN